MNRKLLLVAGLTSVALFASMPGASSDPGDPVVVGTDAVGDWGGGGDASIVGQALGQDLIGASIAMPTADTVNFNMEVTFLPSTGGIPEVSRYTWDMLLFHTEVVNGQRKYVKAEGEFLELDGKWTNYSRGVCDPTSGQCPPPRDPGQQPFLVRGDCTTNPDTNVTTCKELGLVKATFAPGIRTITVPVPASMLKLGPCSVIAAGPNLFGGSISANPAAFFSSSGAPLDFLEVTGTFSIPSDDPNLPCPPPPVAPAE